MLYRGRFKKNWGFTLIESIIVIAILSIIGNTAFSRWKKQIATNAEESDKLKVVMSINNSNIDSLNENINRKIAFNTDSPNSALKKGVYIYRTSVNGSTSGFEQDSGANYTGPLLSPTPTPHTIFECEKKNSPVKSCPVFIFDSPPDSETGISYGSGQNLVLPTITASKGKIFKIVNNNRTSLSFVSYTFDSENYPRNRIFFNSYYSTLQIYVYQYIGAKDGTAPTRTGITTYHQNRISTYAPDKDPDWKREKYYVIPLKIEL